MPDAQHLANKQADTMVKTKKSKKQKGRKFTDFSIGKFSLRKELEVRRAVVRLPNDEPDKQKFFFPPV